MGGKDGARRFAPARRQLDEQVAPAVAGELQLRTLAHELLDVADDVLFGKRRGGDRTKLPKDLHAAAVIRTTGAEATGPCSLSPLGERGVRGRM